MIVIRPPVALAALCLTLLAGCAGLVPQTMALRSDWPRGVPWRSRIEGVPFITQQDFQCGPASLASAMAKAGKAISMDELVQRVYLPARRGSLQTEMLATPRAYGLVTYQISPRTSDLLQEVAAGNPVLVLQDRGAWPISRWHYTLVTGYDYPAGELILHDGTSEEAAMPFTVFEYVWKKSGYWAFVVMPPDRLSATASAETALRAIQPFEHLAGKDAAMTAQLAYQAYLRRWPDSILAMVGLSSAEYRLGNLTQAETVLRKALELAPDNPAVLNNLAQVLSDQGNQAAAGALITRASKQRALPELRREIEVTSAEIRRRTVNGGEKLLEGKTPSNP